MDTLIQLITYGDGPRMWQLIAGKILQGECAQLPARIVDIERINHNTNSHSPDPIQSIDKRGPDVALFAIDEIAICCAKMAIFGRLHAGAVLAQRVLDAGELLLVGRRRHRRRGRR